MQALLQDITETGARCGEIWVWITYHIEVSLALAHSSNCHLAMLATLLPVPGERVDLVQRIRRWLDNQAVT